MSKLTKVLSVWLDETTDAADPKWIVSKDELNWEGKTETTQTLKFFDEYDDAVEFAKKKAHKLQLAVYETENTPSAKNELIYQPCRKIEFFQNENGMAIWAGEGRVLANTEIVDCPLDFGVDDFEDIYEAISEQIAEGETEGSFSNQYEKKYTWEVK